MTTSLYPFRFTLSTVSLSTTVAAALHTDNRCATLAFAQGVTKASISLFHNIYNAAYSGGSQINGDPFHKFWYIQDYQGYLVFIIAWDSFHLNLDNNIP